MTPLTPIEVQRVAQRAVTIFRIYSLNCCLFGSLACHIWGMVYRDPKDVDLVVLDNDCGDTELLKTLLAVADGDFYLVPSRDPDATYRVLYYTVGPGRSCKVDILTIGSSTSLNLPPVPLERVRNIHPFVGLPVMPLLPLLLMKIQGWLAHRESQKVHERAKVLQDAADVRMMLYIAVEKKVHIHDPECGWMPLWFVRQMKFRVSIFVREYPDSLEDWNRLGITQSIV
ncbi:hypothetical protein C8R42DRAFT_167617 [Lentinula raphanica]|nr:hypothetical protein C8R42DRAFT_167617 [Lentinula raphanica]